MYSLICCRCKRPFQARFKDVKICNDCKNRPCEVCGKNFVHAWPYDQRACSAKCRKILINDPANIARKEAKRKKTVQDKYGVDNVSKLDSVKNKISLSKQTEEYKEKVEQTSLEKYGVEHYRQAPEVIAKTKATMIERYGFDNAAKADAIRQKISERLQDPEVRSKYIQSCMSHYGVPHPNLVPEVRAKREATSTERYGVPYYVMTHEYATAQATNQISHVNKMFAHILQDEFGIECEFEFPLGKSRFDLHIKDSNILIEIDPSYTHSDLPNHWDKEGKPKNYHLNKTKLAEKHGYRCIHIFDWDNMEKIAKLLQPKEAIYARKCKLVKLPNQQVNPFIDLNHLQGAAKGAKYCYGLIYNGELVSAMTFSMPRYNRKYEWELLRLCTVPNKVVLGGASRMMSHFIQDASPRSMISYCDKAKFSGDAYFKLGFGLHHISPPAKIWSKGTEYVTDNLLRQRGFDQLFNAHFGKGTSNEELMLQHGWRSVYDCGQMVFEWKNNQ